MKQCEHCNQELNQGHVIMNGSFLSLAPSFYLCIDCFNKFYNEEVAEIMYNDGLQYYTEWEEDENE